MAAAGSPVEAVDSPAEGQAVAVAEAAVAAVAAADVAKAMREADHTPFLLLF